MIKNQQASGDTASPLATIAAHEATERARIEALRGSLAADATKRRQERLRQREEREGTESAAMEAEICRFETEELPRLKREGDERKKKRLAEIDAQVAKRQPTVVSFLVNRVATSVDR